MSMEDLLKGMDEALRSECAAIAGEIGLDLDLQEIWYFPPTPFDADCVAAVRAAAERAEYGHRDIVSGAGHDACYVARVAPTAMVFVPCENGISHNEIENATPDDLAAGAQVLLQAAVARANEKGV